MLSSIYVDAVLNSNPYITSILLRNYSFFFNDFYVLYAVSINSGNVGHIAKLYVFIYWLIVIARLIICGKILIIIIHVGIYANYFVRSYKCLTDYFNSSISILCYFVESSNPLHLSYISKLFLDYLSINPSNRLDSSFILLFVSSTSLSNFDILNSNFYTSSYYYV